MSLAVAVGGGPVNGQRTRISCRNYGVAQLALENEGIALRHTRKQEHGGDVGVVAAGVVAVFVLQHLQSLALQPLVKGHERHCMLYQLARCVPGKQRVQRPQLVERLVLYAVCLFGRRVVILLPPAHVIFNGGAQHGYKRYANNKARYAAYKYAYGGGHPARIANNHYKRGYQRHDDECNGKPAHCLGRAKFSALLFGDGVRGVVLLHGGGVQLFVHARTFHQHVEVIRRALSEFLFQVLRVIFQRFKIVKYSHIPSPAAYATIYIVYYNRAFVKKNLFLQNITGLRIPLRKKITV